MDVSGLNWAQESHNGPLIKRNETRLHSGYPRPRQKGNCLVRVDARREVSVSCLLGLWEPGWPAIDG